MNLESQVSQRKHEAMCGMKSKWRQGRLCGELPWGHTLLPRWEALSLQHSYASLSAGGGACFSFPTVDGEEPQSKPAKLKLRGSQHGRPDRCRDRKQPHRTV